MTAIGYPLSAIVGQEALIEALLVNAVSPEVGGVLVRGERGTAKSTAVRALAPLLPEVGAAVGEAFAFAPGELAPGGLVPLDALVASRAASLVELPIGATLDRLVGALDLGRALAGEQAFEPGLLARAHQGILYVDEVNLLPDHLVDALLDAAASGVARVEREAVSASHAARFLLVGTMNVEEGELRPQLLDRFGLGVEVRAPRDRGVRAEIVRRRLAFERDPEGFVARWASAEDELRSRIAAARARVDAVRLPERELLRITGACAELGIDGVRGDIVCARAAQALAALDGADEVTESHVRRAAALALAHRRHRDPLDAARGGDEELDRALDDAGAPDDEPPGGGGGSGGSGGSSGNGGPTGSNGNGRAPAGEPSSTRAESAPSEGDAGSPADAGSPGDAAGFSPTAPARERHDPPAPAQLPLAALVLQGAGRGPAGRRARTRGAGAGAIDSRPAGPEADDLALVATLRARLLDAASVGAATSAATDAGPRPTGPIPLRQHVRAGRESVLLCLVIDASGSMGARQRLARVKGALIGLLRDAYARRDRVAVVAFRDAHAELLVAPGAPLQQAAEAIRNLPTGGRTPLAEGLLAADRVIRREALRERGRRCVAIVLTDARVRDPEQAVPRAARALGRAAAAVHVVDTEDGPVRLGLAGAVAAAAGGQLHHLVPATRRSAA